MLFCPFFTRSARFFHADQFVTRLRRVERTATCCRVIPNFMRMSTGNVFMNVMESAAVFWWAAICRTPLVDVRQNSASVIDPVLVDEQLEES